MTTPGSFSPLELEAEKTIAPVSSTVKQNIKGKVLNLHDKGNGGKRKT